MQAPLARTRFLPLTLMLLTILGSSNAFATEPGPATPVQPLELQCGGPRHAELMQAFQQAQQFAYAGNDECVDYFFATAVQCWGEVTEGLSQDPPQLWRGSMRLYNSAVVSSLIYGQHFGRLDLLQGLKVRVGEEWYTVPVTKRGMPWRLDQIDCLRTAGTCFENPHFLPTVRVGLGGSLLGVHFRRSGNPEDERFFDKQAISITALLCPNDESADTPSAWRFEFNSPINETTKVVQGYRLGLSRNIAAAVQFVLSQLEAEMNPIKAFLQPEIAMDHEGLLMCQPYQPGKIPLVLVHGLLSSPTTWGTILNDLLNQPKLMERYQIWVYLYPTSMPFLATAADLRKDLRSTLCYLDPNGRDPALQNMILMGHSMGGLLSRLQVVHSGHILWNLFAKVPFSELEGTPQQKQKIADWLFFEPQPFITRVVFMSVPHKGSGMSQRLIGCLGKLLAGQPHESAEDWKEVRRLNKDNLRPYIPRRLPSSVRGLSPRSPGLKGLNMLPFASHVKLHSIIGTGGLEPCFPGDGVVAVDSARIGGVESELFVDAGHSSIKEQPETLREIHAILWLHLRESPPDLSPIPEQLAPTPDQQFDILPPLPTP
ncbi:esterase/lipase family protein [Thalassoroseus pseudoceratinae]|uniref:esterase/lipase family protein n=1 Tax=Thalassoroseus pseudoceratinae TaxID=2713176 RepID=UPI0014233319|nr:alpha/beta hydrolase [Thalassoroseus pseudoceratinae]